MLRLPTSTQTPGPAQVQQLFRTTQEISSLVTLSTQQGGSRVIFGNLLTLPVNDGLLYVEPFYIQGQASTTSFPQLNRVLVWYAERVGVGQTLQQALTAAAAQRPGTGTGRRRRGQGRRTPDRQLPPPPRRQRRRRPPRRPTSRPRWPR